MSIEKITSAILEEAARESEEILNAADTKNRGVIRELEDRIEIETGVAIKRAEAERDIIISRRKSVADIDSKKIILAKKQEIINNCFDGAIDYIVGMEEAKYIEFLVSLGKNSGFKEGVLIFNTKDKDTIGHKVVAALEAAITDGKFEVSQETRKIRGGYILKKGKVYINNSVEAMVEAQRSEAMGEVAQILFSPE
jgi:V/A-type H+-transporting ATPase subunit E